MAQKEKFKIDKVYRLWDSTYHGTRVYKSGDYAKWLPEVVGTEGELRRIGSILVANIPDEASTDAVGVEVQPVKFIDADVTKYRKLLSFFRRKHRVD